jgi:hypothetical protein
LVIFHIFASRLTKKNADENWNFKNSEKVMNSR